MTLLDLSQPIYEGIPVYPGDPFFESKPFAEHDTDGFHATRYALGSHLGTHIDAPFHFFVDGETLDSFPPEFFYGSAACLNLAPSVGPDSTRYRSRADRTRPCSLTVADLAPFEPLLETVSFLLLRTDWSTRHGAADFYDDFPSLSPDVCDWLADYPQLRVLGLETPSLVALPGVATSDAEGDLTAARKPRFDPELGEFLPEDSTPKAATAAEPVEPAEPTRPLDEIELHADSECHRILLGRRPPILILEGLVNLESVPQYDAPEEGVVSVDDSRRFDVSCFPLPFVGADGSPTRVVAYLP